MKKPSRKDTFHNNARRSASLAVYPMLNCRPPADSPSLAPARLAQARQVFGGDVTRNVFAVEAGRLETRQRGIDVARGLLHVAQILVDQASAPMVRAISSLRPVAISSCCVGMSMPHGEAHRSAAEAKPCWRQAAPAIHDLAAGRAARWNHPPAARSRLELHADGVELLAHGFAAHSLARHDERATDVAVLDQALAVIQASARPAAWRRDARNPESA